MTKRSMVLIVLAVGTAVLWTAVLQSRRPKAASAPSAVEPLISRTMTAPLGADRHVDAKPTLTMPAPAARNVAIKPTFGPVRERAAQPSSTHATVADDDDARSEEDEQMRTADNRPEQREWRAAWAGEVQDDDWTDEVRDEVADKTKVLAEGDVKLSTLSCRETVCRMHLQFSDQLDAQAFIAAPFERALDYEYQGLDSDFDGQGFDDSNHSYEVLIKRERPAHLPARSRPPEIDRSEGLVAGAVQRSADAVHASTLQPGEVMMKGAATLRSEAAD